MRVPRPEVPSRHREPGGFTLVELVMVIAIIGIIVSLVMVVSADGLRRAESRATQGLIAKLDMGVTDRLDALMSRSVPVNGAHEFLAAINPPGVPVANVPWGLTSSDRARVIARLDDLKANMPDTFTVQANDFYPLNFGGVPYAGLSGDDAYLLPIGHMAPAFREGQPGFTGTGDNPLPAASANLWRARATGIYGASWAARAAFHKALGMSSRAYDGVDNDGNGWIDEWTEEETGMSQDELDAIRDRLASNYNPRAARGAALYVLLIEGIGPMGSMFSRDEFTDRQVQDTNGDGLLEFVDAWGQPIQFYRWPLYYESPIQKGAQQYSATFEQRETSPLDPNSTLIAPAWWSAQFNGGTAGSYPTPSGKAGVVMNHFLSLRDPSTAAADWTWDRAGNTPRRAYYSRPLIISSGPDLNLGLVTPPISAPLTPDDVRFARPLLIDTDARGFDDISNQTLQQSMTGGAQ